MVEDSIFCRYASFGKHQKTELLIWNNGDLHVNTRWYMWFVSLYIVITKLLFTYKLDIIIFSNDLLPRANITFEQLVYLHASMIGTDARRELLMT